MKLRRFGIAAAVVLLHAGAFQALLTIRESARAPEEPRPLAWITLPQAVAELPAPIAPSAPTLSAPALGIQFPPAIVAPPTLPSDPDLAALRERVSCGLADQGRLWNEDKKRCEDAVMETYEGPLAPRQPTEEELELAKKFAQDKKFQDSAVLLPCFGPGGLSLKCMLAGAITGEFEMGSYADMREPNRTETMRRYTRTDDIRGRMRPGP